MPGIVRSPPSHHDLAGADGILFQGHSIGLVWGRWLFVPGASIVALSGADGFLFQGHPGGGLANTHLIRLLPEWRTSLTGPLGMHDELN